MTHGDNNTRMIGSPVTTSREYADNLSWQRAGLSANGRYTGRDYYDRRLTEPGVDLVKTPRTPEPGAAWRTVKVAGVVIALAGVAGWLWMILAFVSSVGAGTLPDDPFGTRLAGIPLGSGGLVAVVAGAVLAGVGTWLANTADTRPARSRWDPNQPL